MRRNQVIDQSLMRYFCVTDMMLVGKDALLEN